MKILTLALIAGLPVMALGQTEPQQTQEQTKETQTTAPAKGKKARPEQQPGKAQAKPQAGTDMQADTHGKAKGRTQDLNKNQPAERSNTSSTSSSTSATRSGSSSTSVNQSTTKVNVQEFKSRHTEVFNLGRHPKEFFVQRYGERHFRLIGSSYFVFVDGCWVAVDVDGFTYTERVICQGDPDFIVVD